MRVFRRLLPLRPDERVVALRLFLKGFFASSAYFICRTIGDSAFLARIGPELLPMLFLLSAVAVSVVTFVTMRAFGEKHPRTSAISVRVTLTIAAATLALLSPGNDRSIVLLGAVYVLAEIRGTLNTVHTIALLNDAFARSPSKAAYTFVAAAAPIAGIVTGILIDVAAGDVSLPVWLCATVVLDLATLASLLGKFHLDRPRRVTASTEDGGAAATRRFLIMIGVLMAGKTIVITIVAFLWKISIASQFHEDEIGMTRYLATFYAMVDALTLLMHLFIAGRLLDRFGLRLPLLGFPLLLGALAIALPFSQSAIALLVLMTIAKGTDVIRRGLHDPALACLYAPIPRAHRPDAIARVKGVVKPMSEAMSASLIALFWPATLLVMAGSWGLATIPWVVAAIAASRTFRRLTTPSGP